MAYPISDVTRRVVYTGSAGVGPYSFSFEILANTDIAVYKDSTLLTLTTDYTVTINSNGTGSVTLVVAATSANNITLVGDRAIARATDFVTGGDLFANSLNDEFDSLVIFSQQTDEKAERGLKAPVTDPTDINMVLPSKTSRANKTLSFDANGNPIAGINASDVANAATYATNAANSATAAASSASSASSSASAASGSASTASTQASNASTSATSASNSASSASTSATNAASSANSASTSASNASTSATNAASSASAASSSASSAASAQASAEAARDATLTAYDNFDDRYLGSKTSDPSVDNDGNALVGGALYFNSTSGVMKLYTGSAWVAAYVSGSGFVAQSSSTGSAYMPAGTTAQRDGAPSAGYLRFNSTLTKFEGYNGTAWSSVGGGATGGGSDDIFIENGQTVTTNYTITTNKHAMSTGPITINSGITVTIPSGSNWVVL